MAEAQRAESWVMADARYWTPLLVLVSGPPGSGKTTLAQQLAQHLRLPHLNRDLIFNGLRHTVGRGAPEQIKNRGVVAEYGAIEYLLATGVSLVADGTLYQGEMEGHVRCLRDLAEVVNLHCRTEHWRERFRVRYTSEGHTDEEWQAMSARIARYGPRIVDPLELACRRIDVTTDDGYDPRLEELVTLVSGSADGRHHRLS